MGFVRRNISTLFLYLPAPWRLATSRRKIDVCSIVVARFGQRGDLAWAVKQLETEMARHAQSARRQCGHRSVAHCVAGGACRGAGNGRREMQKKAGAGPCKTLSCEQRAEIERQLRMQGRLQTSADELAKLRNARRLKAGGQQHETNRCN
jgi:hypothetical protein